MSIDEFSGEYRFLSNFWIEHRNYPRVGECPSVEHFYQASKCEYADDREHIVWATSPGLAKRYGRKVAIRGDWEEVKLDVMRTALKVKFAHGTALAGWLLETGDEFLREGNNWGDRFWGAVWNESQMRWIGENWLGWLLMAQRAELRYLRSIGYVTGGRVNQNG